MDRFSDRIVLWNIEKRGMEIIISFFIYINIWTKNDSIMEMKRDRNFKQIIGRSDLGFFLNDRAPWNT